MKRIHRLFAAICLCLPVLGASPQLALAASEAGDPLSIVRNIYLQYATDGEAFDVPERYFSSGLLELWRDVEGGADGDVAEALGFPVFNDDGEDETIEIDDVRLLLLAEKYVVASYVVMVEEDKAIAATKKYFQYNFEETPDGWKIDNIDWGPDKNTLRDALKEIKALHAMK